MLDNSFQDKFKPGQIVCLESDKQFLYGEVIQVVISRQLCWVRPLTIVSKTSIDPVGLNFELPGDITDLRTASDLLLPLCLFRAGYDTEVMEILMQLAVKEEPQDKQKISANLNRFVQKVCQENPELFAS